jgi:hypothetical protein
MTRVALTYILAALILSPSAALPQSLTSGDITGTVLDPSGAAVSNATVTLTNKDTGTTQTTTTNSTGAYRFSLLNPGKYSLSVNAPGFQTVAKHVVTVAVGQAASVDIQLQVAGANTTVEVTSQAGVVQTENGNVTTTITPEQVENIPNPGNDLSYYVQTAPGATMNTQAGYGNTSTFGISATSNLFTVDGMNENDPFLNLNNSGATNLMLGANDVATASVVNNGYSGEYGELAGANVNYVTKSGSNKFHGNAEYFWNGSVLNANDWFHNNTHTPRAFDNANQWAASFGGPVIKDKTFFFVDTEGLRLLIPTAQPVNIPSPEFQAATLANLAATNSAEILFYNQIFSIYNNALGAKRATNSLANGGCDSASVLPAGVPCALKFESNVHNLTHEWLLTARVDQNIGDKDRAFIHFRTDHGLQATITDPLTPVLNAQSDQPQYEGQFQETHQIGTNVINQFILAGSWYSAIFKPPNLRQAIALMPYQLTFSSGQFATPGSNFYSTWPQGRNVTQYQISDDLAWQKGNHNAKFGVNFRRNDLTDYTPGGFNATIPTAIFNSEGSFFNGNVDVFQQAFATRPTEPIAVYSLGLYAQDEWAVRRRLKITLSLRAEHNSNPVCQANCFDRLANSFSNISHDPLQPYNKAIKTRLHQALPNYENIGWEPRLGFAWQPFSKGKTVIRGGAGIFADVFPGTVATAFDTNPPLKNTFLASGAVAPNLPGNAQTVATASNLAFVSGFNSGFNIAQIEAVLPSFSPPGFTNAARRIHYPTYDEWNLEFQHALGSKMSFSVNYVGNHGSYLAAENPGLNAYCNGPTTTVPFQPGLPDCQSTLGVGAFVGLPSTPLDPRFTTITEVSNPGVSNYYGLTASFARQVNTAFQVRASFTWSHAMDDISNGGFLPFNFDTNTSILAPQDPSNFRRYNYGNADYDVRRQFNLSYVYHTPKLHGLWDALLDWTISGAFFARSGLPFTVVDGASTGALGTYNYGPFLGLDLFANSSVGPVSCTSSAVFKAPGTTKPCLTPAQFTSPVVPGGIATFGKERRNQVYGPMFFDTDLTVMKNFRIPGWEGAEFQVGAQAFNVLNHPNFDQPVGDLSNSQFGTIIRTVGTPTSIFGSFLGGDSSPRALQIRAQLRF